MRPVSLTFAGLRSYRSEVTIDFTDLDLFAIIGDTGAGKSTIIEALSLALYGKKTWVGGANQRDLIADGEQVLRVSFTFMADGHEWTVTRSWKRSSAQGVNKLVRTDGQESVDNSRAVNARIEQLLGLDHAQFTRTVVIPQGRFDELLQATKGERTKLLTSLLGLDEVRKVGVIADAIVKEWNPAAATAEALRARLPLDPAAALVVAETDAVRTAERRDQLARAVTAADAHRRRLDAIEGARTAIAAASTRVPESAGEVDVLEAAATAAAELGATVASARAQRTALGVEAGALVTRQATLLDGFTKLDGPRRAADALLSAADRLAELGTEIDEAGAALDAARADPPASSVPDELTEAADRAAADAAAAQEEATRAREALDDARRALDVLRPALDRWQLLLAQRAERQAGLADLDRAIAEATDDLADRSRTVEGATSALEAARTADLAATVAEHCAPDEPCPVCDRPLPASFSPPPSADLDEARAAVAAATQARDEAATRHGRAVHERSAAEVDIERLASDLGEIVEVAAKAAALLVATGAAVSKELADLSPGTAPIGPAAGSAPARSPRSARTRRTTAGTTRAPTTPVAPDPEVVLAPLVDAAAAADAARAVSGRAQIDAEAALASARAAIDAAQDQHARAVADAERHLAELRARAAKAVEVADRLPSHLRPPAPVTPEGLRSAADAAAMIDSSLDEVMREERRIQRAIHDTDTELLRLDAALAASVVHPVQRALDAERRRLHTVRTVADLPEPDLPEPDLPEPDLPGTDVTPTDAIERLCTVLEQADAFDLDADLAQTVAVLAREVADAEREATAVLARAEATVGRLDEAQKSESAALDAVLLAALQPSVPALLDAAGAARVEAEAAQARRNQAAAAVEEAARLDRFLAVGRPFLSNLGVLVEAVRDRHFIGHLVQSREAALIAEASRRLRDISKGRFGFVSDFGIVTIASGEIRSPDTLSGGERFQAALALALALVEIVSRGSGKLEAVFVDEGFGSLDAAALDTALATLGNVAGGGKTVALISHLRPVAEYVDTVLHVTKSDVLGSRITLLDAEARDRLLADDIRSGLTA